MERDWLRWTVPPGISLLVHAVLIGVIAYIGMQISAARRPSERGAVTELALPAPPIVPQQERAGTDSPKPEGAPVSRALPDPTPELPDRVASQARSLGQARPVPSARMDPVTLEAMRTRSGSIASPGSTSPPSVDFAGVQSRSARTLVYAVDGSGATANSFSFLQAQLMRSIERLSPTQRFQVVLFREDDASGSTLAPIGDGQLARATNENKQRVSDWLDGVSARGRSNPLEGLEAALALKPDLILLITRSIQRTEMGWAQGQREILRTLDTLNPREPLSGQRDSVIKCVQLLDDDPTGIMRAIAGLHGDGGEDYRVVSYDDLVSTNQQPRIEDRSIGASDEQRIAAGAELWGALAQSGTLQTALASVISPEQRIRIIDDASSVRALVAPLREQDPRGALLWSQSTLALLRADALSEREPALRAIVGLLAPQMYSDPAADAQRVITLALSRAELGQRALALQQLGGLRDLSDELGLDDITRAQVHLAIIALGGDGGDLGDLAARAPFTTPGGGVDALWGLLLREAVTIDRLRTGQDNAWTPLLRVRERAAGTPGIADYIDQRLALIYERYGHRDDTTPASVLLAAGGAMARSIPTRTRAMELYQRAGDAPDADEQTVRDALWQAGVLGRAIGRADSRAASNRALTRLARDFPSDPRSLGAISSAIGASDGDAPDLLRRRLEIATANYPESPTADLWRLRLGELREGFSRLDTLDAIEPGTREGVLAGELYEQTVLGMLDVYEDPQVRLGLERRMLRAASRFDLPSADMWTTRAIISESLHDPRGALAQIDTLITRARSRGEPSDELRLLRARTLLRLGQPRSAFAELRDLIAQLDASGKRTSIYWQSWAIMLERVGEDGTPAERAEARRHLARLRLIDPGLGGSPWDQRLHDAGETLHSEP